MSVPPLSPVRSPGLHNRDDSRLLIVDVQEKLLRVIPGGGALIDACSLLVRGAQLLRVPVFATEQYPQGLGPTAEPLRGLLPDRPAKLRFSAVGAFDWAAAAGDDDRRKVVLAGIETHVCIQQTAFDLLAAGFSVTVVADAVASRFDLDHRVALDRLRDHGADVTSAEAMLFEWCETAAADEFKQVSSLVKSRQRTS